MSYLYISEFSRISHDFANIATSIPCLPSMKEQYLPITMEGKVSEPFTPQTRFILVSTDEDCCIAVGTSPEPDPRLHKLFAKQSRIYGVSGEDKIAVMRAE